VEEGGASGTPLFLESMGPPWTGRRTAFGKRMAGGQHYQCQGACEGPPQAGASLQIFDVWQKNDRSKAEQMQRKNRIKQYIFVIKELTAREIKRKYARSSLGVLWSILNPLLNMSVMSLIFSTMFKRSIENFPIYYLTGQIFWGLFSGATNSSMTALVDNKNLLIKAKLPKQTFLLSRIYTALVNFGYTCLAFVLMLAVFRIRPTVTVLLFPVDVLFAMAFSMGIGYMLSVAYVFFADIKYLYSVLLALWMHLSAIFYPVDRLSANMQLVICNNPVYLMIAFARECVMYGTLPAREEWVKLAAWSLGTFVVGMLVFRSKENQVMQRI
jgi:ABC-type polysaccharide/polyol phosphate export permease